MRILIIEDNIAIAKALKFELKSYFSVDVFNNGEDGLRHALATQYDTILLDLNLPDIDGEDICRAVRKKSITTPILIISGREEVSDKVNLLDMGADDYITKPFNLHELRSRINVAIRHISQNGSSGSLTVKDLVLDPSARKVTRAGISINLRRKEYDLLEYLVRNQGMILTRTMVLEHIWDMNENNWANVVDVHIKYLRDKIDRPFENNLIKTVHGVGYKIEA